MVSSATLSPADFIAALGEHADAFDLRRVDRCASTNSMLVEHIPADGGRIPVLVADHQTAGRGRRGRQWCSWPEGSLAFSALWRFADGAPAPAGLSLAAGLALARALENLGAEGVQLKWPNDVLIHGGKIAGILIELLPGRGRVPAAVIGIGVNLRLPADAAIPGQSAVTDLYRELGRDVTRPALLAAILRELRHLLATYAAAGFPALRGAWQQRNAFAGLPVRIDGENTHLTGLCVGVDDDGALLLDTGDGVQRILSGELSLRAAT